MRGRSALLGIALVALGASSVPYVVHGTRFDLEREESRRRRTSPVPFDRALWLRETDDRSGKEENWRHRMADDVVRRWVRTGMTRAQVVDRLGLGQPLTEKEYQEQRGGDRSGSDPHPNRTTVLAYWTLDRIDLDGGSEPVEEIYVFLDTKGRVTRVTQDIAMN